MTITFSEHDKDLKAKLAAQLKAHPEPTAKTVEKLQATAPPPSAKEQIQTNPLGQGISGVRGASGLGKREAAIEEKYFYDKEKATIDALKHKK